MAAKPGDTLPSQLSHGQDHALSVQVESVQSGSTPTLVGSFLCVSGMHDDDQDFVLYFESHEEDSSYRLKRARHLCAPAPIGGECGKLLRRRLVLSFEASQASLCSCAHRWRVREASKGHPTLTATSWLQFLPSGAQKAVRHSTLRIACEMGDVSLPCSAKLKHVDEMVGPCVCTEVGREG
eukprot:CAMPEP_0113287524 /NCGR_PEP_ID=MMETSP0008_2-20120614/31754_1 /TAXON_ID=97485 /ORGANISM="Prymnesium parvum" /LENGTH=180 /DNA_ID=CAMNT_0000138761 /DNA_START=491 /DNA_END=1034 /DNA_ORIENTATION=+ /assembly_acc=CAM_ASM_000153